MVEHDTVNVEVGGSNPLLAANICSNSPMAETIALEAIQCRFKSYLEYQKIKGEYNEN